MGLVCSCDLTAVLCNDMSFYACSDNTAVSSLFKELSGASVLATVI